MAAGARSPSTTTSSRLVGSPSGQNGTDLGQIGPQPLVRPDALPDQRELVGTHPVEVAGQVEPSGQPGDQAERDLLRRHARLRVRPVARLLGSQRGGRGRGDRRVQRRVHLVRGRLQLEQRHQRVVHPHGPGGAVLDQQVGMPVADAGQPVELGAVLLQQPVADAERVPVGAGPGRHVVVELEEPGTVAVDQAVHDLVEVAAGGRVPQIEEVPLLLDDPASVPLQERRVRQPLGRRGPHPDHLGLDPQTRQHAAVADVVEDPLQTPVGEAGRRWLPVPHTRPPVTAVVVPAGVDAEVLGTGLGGGVDQRQQLLGGRIAHQGVHVVVDDHRQVRADEGPTDGAPVRGQGGDRALPTLPGDGDRRGYGLELLARVQPDRPVMIEVVGSADDHGDLVGSDPATVHLPAPGPVVLDLPGQRATGGGVVDHGRGQDLARRPGRGADRRAVGSRLEVPVRRGDPAETLVVPQPNAAPAALRAPAVLRRVQHQVIERLAVVEDAAQGQRADHLHDPLVVGGVPHRAVGLESRHVGVRGERGAGRQAGRVVALLDDQPGRPVVDDDPMRRRSAAAHRPRCW